MFYIYKITNTLNGKVYIGKTNDLYQRKHSHLSIARNGAINPLYRNNGKYNYIHRAITKYGEDNFTFDIIDQNENEDIIFQLETHYISQFQSTNRTIGYNLTTGGEGSSGRKQTETAKQKMREKATGRLHTDKTKQQMSADRSGEGCGHNVLTKEQIPEIIRLRNEERLSYPKIGKMFGVSKTAIRKICIGKSWK
jgi:group I intron endonuclease